jgi:uncharacterized protein
LLIIDHISLIKDTKMETAFTPLASTIGGIMIGLAATLLMLVHGRIMGLTGIVSGVMPPLNADWQWRAAFLAGTIAAPLIYVVFGNEVPFSSPTPTGVLIVGGVIVGFGVKYGSGCTSGHGICGIARLSPRSIVATCLFMASTFVTVFIIRHVLA